MLANKPAMMGGERWEISVERAQLKRVGKDICNGFGGPELFLFGRLSYSLSKSSASG